MSEAAIELDPAFGERFSREKRPPCQLYLISPATLADDFADQLRAALDGGPVAAFQLRLKDVPDAEVMRTGEALKPVCAAHDVAFILNDRADLAAALGADGVHLGQSDGEIADARKLLGPGAQIGRTCHDSRHLAMDAAEAGADYVAFGAFYETTTKPSHYRPAPELLSWWTTLSGTPSVAIGGITPANAPPLVEAGADFLAVCNAVWQAEGGPGAAVRAFERVMA